jgi:hypothetical protein
MMRRFTLLLLLIAALGCGAGAMLLVERSGWFTPDVVTTAHSQIISLHAQARLEVARARLQSRITRGIDDPRWGKARTHIFFSGTASYGLDLRQIRAEDLRYDAATNVLRVALPPVDLGLVEPDTQSIEIIQEETGVRGFFSDGQARQSVAVKDMTPVLRRDAWTPAMQGFARASAQRAIKTLLENSLRATGRPITVEPYFPDAARPS